MSLYFNIRYNHMLVVRLGTPRAGLSPLNEIKILIMGDFMYFYFSIFSRQKMGVLIVPARGAPA